MNKYIPMRRNYLQGRLGIFCQNYNDKMYARGLYCCTTYMVSTVCIRIVVWFGWLSSQEIDLVVCLHCEPSITATPLMFMMWWKDRGGHDKVIGPVQTKITHLPLRKYFALYVVSYLPLPVVPGMASSTISERRLQSFVWWDISNRCWPEHSILLDLLPILCEV